MRNRAMTIAGMLALVVGLAMPASAQVTGTQADPLLELSIGYQVLRVGGGDDTNTYPLGVALDGTWYRGPFGLVAEVGWSRDSTDIPNVSVSSSYLHIGGGGRFLIVRDGRVRPHLQILGGVSRASFSSQFDPPGGMPVDIEGSDTAFMVQPGIGFTFAAGESANLALALDYRRAFFEEGAGLGYADTNEIRFWIGVRFSLD